MSQGNHRAQDRPGKKFFGEEGEREGKDAPFVHKRGASPSLCRGRLARADAPPPFVLQA